MAARHHYTCSWWLLLQQAPCALTAEVELLWPLARGACAGPFSRKLVLGEALGGDMTVAEQVRQYQGKKVREIPRIGKPEVKFQQNHLADSTKPGAWKFSFLNMGVPCSQVRHFSRDEQ